MGSSLREFLAHLEIDNIYIYIADAVRWDHLPRDISQRGVTAKTIASSIHTPTSFSSIVTGLHPPQHGVNQFGDVLNQDISTLFSFEATNAYFANTINQKFNEKPSTESILDKTLGTDEVPPIALQSVESPFVFIERGPGGHAPYGDFSGNAWEYFRDRRSVSNKIYRNEYRRSIENDTQYFIKRLNYLKESKLLEDTLVIYTSDHGELLGECGCIGHNSPVHPKLTYVPTVFIHPTANVIDMDVELINHIDFFPTICSLLNLNAPSRPGRDLTCEAPLGNGACYYTKQYFSINTYLTGCLSYDSLWDVNGGYVFSRVGTLSRLSVYGGKLLKSAKREYMRNHYRESLRFYLSNKKQYNQPGFTSSQANDILVEISQHDAINHTEYPLSKEVEARLHELGYMK